MFGPFWNKVRFQYVKRVIDRIRRNATREVEAFRLDEASTYARLGREFYLTYMHTGLGRKAIPLWAGTLLETRNVEGTRSRGYGL